MPDSQHDVTDSAQPDSANKRDSLMDVAEPDDAFLLASEQEDSLAAPRRGLIVIVTDHPGEQSDSTSQLVSELLAEANFRVDGAIVVGTSEGRRSFNAADVSHLRTRRVPPWRRERSHHLNC